MRFAKPLTVTLAGAALMVLPLSGAAFADTAKPEATAIVKTPRPVPAQPTESKIVREKEVDRKYDEYKKASLTVSVDRSRVRAGASYTVTITAKGLRSRMATITSPEGKSYHVALSDGSATKTLTVPAKARPGTKTVTVKVGNKVATASFTVVDNHRRDDRRHDDGK